MAGTVQGGKRAAASNKERYGDGFYKHIGAIGGSRRVPKGFARNLMLASSAGKVGGKIGGARSKRTKGTVAA